MVGGSLRRTAFITTITRRSFTSRYASTASISYLTSQQTFTLPDERSLGFGSYGSEKGEPVFYFHGCPGSRLEGGDWDEMAQKLSVRIITIDRPGMGLSTYKPAYSLLDWPSDVHNLAKHLGYEKFRVCGGSGGGPYAIACAHLLPKE